MLPDNPIIYAWESGKMVSGNDDFENTVVIRKYYEENGYSICEEKLCIEEQFLKVLTDCDKGFNFQYSF